MVLFTSDFTYYEPGVPSHLRLEYGEFRFGTRELFLVVTGKVSMGQLPGKDQQQL
jgi:hypothetical protein